MKSTDFSLIRMEKTMGLNKIFLGFQRFLFYPKYYVAINKRVIQQSATEISALNCVRFIKDLQDENPLPPSALTHFIHARPEPGFFLDLREGFFEGYTVTFAALQIAYFMGFTTVISVGMDHRYSFTGEPNAPSLLEGEDPNHLDATYFQGQTWDHPDLANSEHFYGLAREVFEQAGRRIIDCSVGGACTVFEKGRLEDVLG
ncbi:MAG: hypothetical protein ACK575_09150 [Cyanobacteriota bacterium]